MASPLLKMGRHLTACCPRFQNIQFQTPIKSYWASSSTAASAASSTPISAPGSSIQATLNGVLSGLVGSINSTKNQSQNKIIASAGLTDRPLFIEPRSVTTCNVNTGVCQVNESFDQRAGCADGGYSSVTSLMTGSVNANGGTLNWTSYSSLVDCSSGGWVTNSSPYLSGGGTIGLFGQRTTVNITLGGGFVTTNAPGTPNGRSECHLSGVLLQYDSTSGSWSNSGSAICTPGGTFKF
jgi:hypothetical protein